MRNIIRADLYRIFRGRGVYIILAVVTAFQILQIASSGRGQIGVSFEDHSAENENNYYETIITPEGNQIMVYSPPEVIMTGRAAPFKVAEMSDNIIFFLLPFLVIVAAADFSRGMVKNTIAGGTSRTKYYASKLILSGLICIALFLVYIIVPIIGGTIINGFGGSFDLEFLGELIKVYLPQLFLIFAYACIGMFITFTLKSKAALISIYLACTFVPSLLIFITGSFNDRIYNLANYLIPANIQSFGYPEGMMPVDADLTRALILGGLYILTCTIGGILLFRKAEIK